MYREKNIGMHESGLNAAMHVGADKVQYQRRSILELLKSN